MPAHTDPACSAAVANAYLELLRDEGYRPRLERDEQDGPISTLWFKAEGTTYHLFAYEDDPEYFRVGALFALGAGRHDAALLGAIVNGLNTDLKGVKTVYDIESNGVGFYVEFFLGGQKVTPRMLERAVGALRAAASQFFEAARPPGRLDA